MFDERNIYVRQAEVKGSFKQNSSGIFLLNELTVNASLKNYKQTLQKAFTITLEELEKRNNSYDCKKEECKNKKKAGVKPKTSDKVRM